MGAIKNIMIAVGYKWKMYEDIFREYQEEQKKILKDIKSKKKQ